MSTVKCLTISGDYQEIEETELSDRQSSYGLVVSDKNELLVEDATTEGGKYWFLGGGLDDNEEPITGLKRELLEEAGITINNIQLLGEITYCYYHNKLNKYFRNHALFYRCHLLNQTNDSNVSTRWLQLSKINKDGFYPLLGEILDKLIRNQS